MHLWERLDPMWLPARPGYYSCGLAGGQGFPHPLGQELLRKGASQGRLGGGGSAGECLGRVSSASKVDRECQN